jgi:serine protease Do
MPSRLVVILLVVLWAAAPAATAATRVPPSSREAVQLSFAPVVRQVAPAVVNITSRRAVEVQRNPFLDDPFFEFFSRRFGGAPRNERRVQQALGSGVIIGADGLIVTNHHVVDGADEIDVVLADRRSFRARLVSSDEHTDLAFLRLEQSQKLPALKIGDSDQIQVGDLVLAVGNPFGIGQTVTSGIVSATARTAPQLERDVSFIQTDAAINPGNSGGALVDMNGHLIGINTAIFSRSGGSIGIGFAVPSNLVAARMRSLNAPQAGAEVARPWIGARLQAVDADIAASLGLDRPAGVLLSEVYPGAAADEGGLRSGDIILTVDGIDITDPASLAYRLSLAVLGEEVAVSVWRRGRVLTMSLPVATAPERPAANVTRLDRSSPLEGATVGNLSPAFNETAGIDPFERGVAVLEVRPGSEAQAWRLRPGDVLEAVNGRQVATVTELLRRLDGGLRRLDVRRSGDRFAVTAGH